MHAGKKGRTLPVRKARLSLLQVKTMKRNPLLHVFWTHRAYLWLAVAIAILSGALYAGLTAIMGTGMFKEGQLPVYITVAALASLLIGVNGALLVFQFRKMKQLHARNAAGTIFGTFAAKMGAGCPVCGAALLTLLGLTGITAALPFGGLEFLAIGVGILGLMTVSNVRKIRDVLNKPRCACCHAD